MQQAPPYIDVQVRFVNWANRCHAPPPNVELIRTVIYVATCQTMQ